MKVQFCFNGDFNGTQTLIAEFDVAAEPTKAQCKAINDYIGDALEEFEEEYDDFEEFDYYKVCREAVNKYLEVVDNPIVKTFYI